MSEETVDLDQYKTPWWDAGSQQRMMYYRHSQPTTYRVTFYEEAMDPAEIKERLDSVEASLVVEMPPPKLAYQDVVGHEIQLDRGTLVIRKIVGVGANSAGWETVAIFPPGEWKKCEAIKYREGK